ncbi:outer membrane channel domain protein [Pseudomonas aeruginosa]|nr:outer membrane channel domain protein [Pseudomonas aeruginosa]
MVAQSFALVSGTAQGFRPAVPVTPALWRNALRRLVVGAHGAGARRERQQQHQPAQDTCA